MEVDGKSPLTCCMAPRGRKNTKWIMINCINPDKEFL